MNLTTTRAAQTACAEPGPALRGLYLNTTTEPDCGQVAQNAHAQRAVDNEVQREGCPVQTESESFGMVLLGIGYDSSVA